MKNEKTLAPIQPRNIQELENFASMASASGYFSDAREAAQAMVKIAAGLEMGIAPIQAMTSIHVIKGRVTLSANLMAAMVRRAGFRYQVRWEKSEAVTIEFFEAGQSIGESRFSIQDAKQAGLGGQNWKGYPRNMLFARAMMNGVRWYLPELALGIYDPEELQPAPAPLQPETLRELNPTPPQQQPIEAEYEETIYRSPEKSRRPALQKDLVEEAPADDGAYPSDSWKAANAKVMAAANSAGIAREHIRAALHVESLTEVSADSLREAAVKVEQLGSWIYQIEQVNNIEDLKSCWEHAKDYLSNGWLKVASKWKDEAKSKFQNSQAVA